MSQSQNPVDKEPKPPFPQQSQPYPGTEGQMQPRPDHGEQSYEGSGKLTGKVALITGADSGIGKAVAIAFAREGADVLIAYLEENEDALDTVRWVEKAGRKAVAVAGDIGDEAHCKDLVDRTIKEFGKLDVLVNNAAYQKTYQDITQIPEGDFERTYRTNVFGMYYLCKAAMAHLKPGASIINTASIEAFQPAPTLLAYAGTKAAIVNFSVALAKGVGSKGIRVNSVAPGPIWTPLIVSTMPEKEITSFGKKTPLGRAGQPAELAPIYVLLASDESSYMTAGVYPVTGGEWVL